MTINQKKYCLLVCIFIAAIILTAPSIVAIAGDMTSQDFVAEAKKNITEVSITDAKAMLDKKEAIFLDVREADEYNEGHIPGAINLPRGLLEFKINEKIPDKNTKIVVYCKSGSRSALAAYVLSRMGYNNIVNLKGGWEAWKLEVLQKPQAEQDTWDFGQVQEGLVVKHNFILKNNSQNT
jgi:rhodanese-related sulfurtransferase